MNDTSDSGGGDSGPGDAWPRRFGWPMRLFLCYFLVDMVVRSLLSLTNCDHGWHEEYHVHLFPEPLPAPAELDQIAAGEHPAGVESRAARLWQSVASIGPFYWPVPSDETRAKLKTPEDVGKYAITWIVTRLAFVGKLVGVDQDWPMFSPNVGTGDTMGRVRLVYADGTSEIHRHAADPADLTRFSHWFEEKPLQVALKIHRDRVVRLGYCMWLAGVVRENAAGSPLVRIEVFTIRYEYPSPDDDARPFLAAQTGPPPEQQEPTFWIYDVATRTGQYVK